MDRIGLTTFTNSSSRHCEAGVNISSQPQASVPGRAAGWISFGKQPGHGACGCGKTGPDSGRMGTAQISGGEAVPGICRFGSFYRSSGVSPVRPATRASILGPISSLS